MNVIDILSNQIFGFAMGILSILVGIFCSQIYYKKGIKEGDKTAQDYKNQLAAAQKEITVLKTQLSALIALADKHELDTTHIATTTSEISEILKFRSNDKDISEKQIIANFIAHLNIDKAKAKNYLTAQKSNIENESAISYMEAFLAFEDGNLEAAAKLFSIASASDDPGMRYTSFYQAGVIFNVLERPSESIKFLNKAQVMEPDNPNCLTAIGSTLIKLGEFEKAKKALDKSYQINPTNPVTIEMFATYYLHSHDYAKTIEYGLKARANGMPAGRTLCYVGDAYRCLGDYINAEKYYAEVLKENPQNPVVRNNLMELLLLQNENLRAELHLKEFLKYNPENILMIFDKYASILNSIGKARDVIQKANSIGIVNSNGISPEALTHLGFSYCHIGDSKNALICFERALLISPNSFFTLTALAKFYQSGENRNLNRSYGYLEQAKKLTGGQFHPYLEMLYAYYFLLNSEFNKAIEVSNQILAVEEGNLEVRELKGFAQSQLKASKRIT